ncbi:Vacuolar protein sorting-associated protein 11 -like protein [Ceratocystis lukuohia]|uniref:E3 ubiquitin-protein ligase PEP5 n=1 Tax=Ceratocystis lukuohia TaxID=2019550 RepID=A0ABR4MSF8_9PEZI
MALSWKSFDFFDIASVKLLDEETRIFFQSNEISCLCTGSDNLFLGSFDGYVRIVNSKWKIVRSFLAHDVGTITHMRQIDGTSLLVTISISAFAAHEDLRQIAVGFANGSVIVIRGDLINDLGAKQRIVHESDEPITGVELSSDAPDTNLFISTTSRILRISISKKGQNLPAKTVEDVGCGVGCMSRDKKTGDVIVAREDALYYYTIDGRGPPCAYESAKSMISSYRDYVALICPPTTETSQAQSEPMKRFGGASDMLNVSTFYLLEPSLRVIAHTESVVSPVKHIFELWDDLYTLAQDGKITRYHEKNLQSKLDMLYQRNLYPLAIELAQKSGLEPEQQNQIFRKFGDFLYQKADYDGAMMQYIRAIDTTEPSQVIRKFLDTQRIHNLISYLEQLHEHRKATADHTTLLLNCYAKLKDIDKLEKFIKSPGDLKFDLDTAISMCRQGGYFEQAAYLAEQHGETEMVVDILVEDSKKYKDALDFICHQHPDTAFPCLMKYARVLIENCPKETTKVFVDYYTGRYRPKIDTAPIESESRAGSGIAATAVQNLTNFIALPYLNNSAIASPGTPGRNEVKNTVILADEDDIPAPKYMAPPPRTAFSSFIDHPDEFIQFLESCLEEPDVKESDKTDLYTTLFEMYLRKSVDSKGEHQEEWESKAKKLIERDSTPMESSNVLLLSDLSDFKDGTTLVKEQSGLLFDIFRSYTSAKDTRGAMKALRKYGNKEPQLYPAALTYLTSHPSVLEEAGASELADVLNKIDKDRLMAPLQVIQTLVGQAQKSGGVATMGMIKPYLSETIERERREIGVNRRRITAFRAETEQKRAELVEISTRPTVFQATRCSDCGGGLELPVVHFLCKHSFHQRCLRGGGAEPDAECPLCAGENATIRALRRAQEDNASKHELFKTELERSEDRLGTIADWYGRGVMSHAADGE